MKLSAYQAQLLMLVLWNSTDIMGSMGGLNHTARLTLYNDILNQQSMEVKDLDETGVADE